MLTIDRITQAVHSACRGRPVSAAFLFGSYARGEATAESDVDLRIECTGCYRFSDVLDIQEALERELGLSVDVLSKPKRLMAPEFRAALDRDERLICVTQ